MESNLQDICSNNMDLVDVEDQHRNYRSFDSIEAKYATEGTIKTGVPKHIFSGLQERLISNEDI